MIPERRVRYPWGEGYLSKLLAPGDEGDSKFPEVRDVPEGRVDLNFISLIHSIMLTSLKPP